METGKELKRNRHLVRSSPIWTAEQGQAGMQAEIKLAVGTVSPKEISPAIPSRRDSSCLQSALIIMSSDQGIVINNQKKHNLYTIYTIHNLYTICIPYWYFRGQNVAPCFTESTPELRLAKDKVKKGAIPFMRPSYSCSFQPQRASTIFLNLNFMRYFFSCLKGTGQVLSLAPAKPTRSYRSLKCQYLALCFSQAMKLDCQDIPQPLNFIQSTSLRIACAHLALTPGGPEPHQHSHNNALPCI